MEEQNKKLLLQEMCARLPYGVKLDFYSKAMNQHYISTLIGIEPDGDRPIIAKIEDGAYTLGQDHIKPYLRPISSMTEKEKNEIKEYLKSIEGKLIGFGGRIIWLTDYYLSHHIDFRNLIGKGIALEAPKDMYQID